MPVVRMDDADPTAAASCASSAEPGELAASFFLSWAGKRSAAVGARMRSLRREDHIR